jgi:lysozyme
MNISQAGLNLVEYFEGLFLNAYWDSTGHVWTIGYGHTGSDVYSGLTITEDQANNLLRSDMLTSDNWVNQLVTVPLTQGQFDALSSFVFNGGPGMLEGTMLNLLNAGDYAGCAAQFPNYCYSGGVYLEGLYNRRIAEQHLFNTGEFNGTIATGGGGGGTSNGGLIKLKSTYLYGFQDQLFGRKFHPSNTQFTLVSTTGKVSIIKDGEKVYKIPTKNIIK